MTKFTDELYKALEEWFSKKGLDKRALSKEEYEYIKTRCNIVNG